MRMKPGVIAFVVGLLSVGCSLAQCPTANFSAMMLVPKVIYEGDPNYFLLEVRNQPVTGSAKISIVNRYNTSILHYEKSFTLNKTAGPTFKLDVSDVNMKSADSQRTVYGLVILDAKFGDVSFKENSSIRVQKDDPLLLIQTDKKIYKPSQKVYVRVMPLDYHLRPKNGGKLSMTISDPLNNVVANWVDVPFNDMVMQFNFQLNEEPAMGSWYVNVRYQSKSTPLDPSPNPVLQTVVFTVAEYVLPKFEVTITPPPFILMDANNATWKICANYTFGKPVIGTLKINSTLMRYNWETYLGFPQQYLEVNISGCYNLTLNISGLNFTNPSYAYRQIQVLANVFEAGTNAQRNATNSISRTTMPLKLTFLPDTSDKYFRPYMNTYGSLKVTNPDDTPAAGEPIELCLTARSETYKFRYQRTDVKIMCRNYTTDATGMINFVLPPHKPSVVSFSIEASSVRFPNKYYPDNIYNTMIQQPRSSTFYRAFFSPSKQYLQFEPVPDAKMPCDTPVRLSAYYTFKTNATNLKFKYVVMARSRNILTQEVTVANPMAVKSLPNASSLLFETIPNTFSDMSLPSDVNIGRLNIEIDPASTQLPQLTVALYYISCDEVVADSIRVKRKVCSANKVGLQFSETVIQPGARVNMTITASPSSQCAYEIIDRSVKLLSGSDNNPFLRYRDDLPDREISMWESPQPDTYGFCQNSGGQSDYVDSESIFLPAGWSAITYNINLKTRPCRSTSASDNVPEPVFFESSKAMGGLASSNFISSSMAVAPSATRIGGDFGGLTASASQSVVDVRDYFPELWLFEVDAVDATGKLFKQLTAPDQVTTWNADAVCIHKTDGLGVAESKEVKTYQAFFAEINLPYSVKRLEVLPIIVSVFNYLPHCMPVKITIEPMPGLEARTPLTSEVCACPETAPLQYQLRVAISPDAQIGDVNITVTAVNSDNLAVCGSNSNVKSVPSRDKITRPLKIIPEGFMVEKINSFLLCPASGLNNATFELVVPENVIKGSARSLFTISGDIMGQAASNLESLIVLPSGCGEQNMAKLMSNLAVRQYLAATSQLTTTLKDRIRRNLATGYQNQLTFRAGDGSYSAWGGQWGQASSFLTAMVYQGFKMAHEHIFVDDNGLSNTFNYIMNTRNKITGCFNVVGSIYSWGLRASEQNAESRGSYTAYVLIALNGTFTNATQVDLAFKCVDAQKNMNQHANALSAYAAALYNRTTLAKKYLDALDTYANIKLPNQKFFYPTDSWSPAAIETSAYAVLAQLTLAQDAASLQKVQPVVRWLMKKQNRNGGFSSSQDTVIALQALAKFAQLTFKDQATINNNLVAKGSNFTENYFINKTNAIIWDTRIVRTIPNNLLVNSTGSGCVVATSQLRYNVPSIPGETGFLLNVTVLKTSTVQNVFVQLCATYSKAGGQTSSMAIIELTPFTFYSVVRESLNGLLSSNQINRYQTGYPVVLYFDEFTATPKCVTVELSQDAEVENLQAGTAVVYDYYDTDVRKSVEFVRGDLPSVTDNSA